MKAIFYYSDGSIVEHEFESEEELWHFAQCEGDHLEWWEYPENIDADK